MNSIEEQLRKRLTFKTASTANPLVIRQWITAHQHQEYWEHELWEQFISPLQLEIQNLRYQPEKAVLYNSGLPDDADDVPF